MGSVTRASFIASLVVGLSVLVAAAAPVGADVITDWNQKALPIVTKYSLGAPAYRDLAIMHLAMYQCVNSIDPDRKSTRLNSSHGYISYAVFCLKKKKNYN